MSARGQIDLLLEQFELVGGDLSLVEGAIVELYLAQRAGQRVRVRLEPEVGRGEREAEEKGKYKL